jgi:hypothetical protein
MGNWISASQEEPARPVQGGRGNIEVSGPVPLRQLRSLSQERGAIRAGATIDPQQRKYGYQAEGYSGVMYYANVDNMRKEENALLQLKQFRHNDHSRSNAQPERGTVYIIKGKRWQ